MWSNMIDFNFGVKLELLSDQDVPWIVACRNSPGIIPWLRQNDPIDEDHQRRWQNSLKFDDTKRFFKFMDNGVKVGVCGLSSIDQTNKHAEFSLWVDPALHGKGYGSKGLSTLLSYGFSNLCLNRIWGETFDGNRAAKTFEKVGFTKEGTRKEFYFKNNVFLDAHLYSIRASDWLSK